MRSVIGLLIASALLAAGQGQEPGQFVHVCTFGSKDGIHPPRISNKKLPLAATGEGDFPYGLGFPVAVATDLHGRIWITDSGTASVHVFDRASGAYREIRRAGSATFEQPAGIVSDRQGRVYMVDSALANVFVFDEQGDFDRALVKPGLRVLKSPTAITLSEDGRTVYVADPPRNMVVALNREGEVDGTIDLTDVTREPGAISVVGNQLYVLGTRQHRVEVFTPGGKRREELRWDGIQFPVAFAYDASSQKFLVANPRLMVVEIFDSAGRSVGAFGRIGDAVDQNRRIDGLFIDPQGLVYVVDSHHGKVVVFRETR